MKLDNIILLKLMSLNDLSQLQKVVLLLFELSGDLERTFDDRTRQSGQPEKTNQVEPVEVRDFEK
jgi:hypothetical protein